MGERYLIDTNVVIAYLDNSLPEKFALEIEDSGSNISVITRMELLAWRNATPENLHKIQSFIDASFVYNLDEPVILKAIDIRKHYRIKLPDVIIAATAIVHNLKLITRNNSDFEKITDFHLINPFQ